MLAEKKRRRTNMTWVVICTVVSFLLANTPLIYILCRVHYPSGLSPLWGYAPNQFLFPLLAFPMAAFSTFLAMKLLVATLQSTPPHHPVIRWTADNWIVVCLIGIIMTSSVCILDYFFSAKTFDKLQPVFAQKAVAAAQDVRRQIMSIPKDDRDEKRHEMIQKWRDEKQQALPQLAAAPDPEKAILALPAGVYLQIVQDPSCQRDLHLMNQTVHALNVAQVFISIFVGFCALFVTTLCVYVFKAEGVASQVPSIRNALSAVFFAVTFFSFFPILYAQQRSEVEFLVGGGYTIMPQVFSGIIVIALLMALATLEPVKGNISEFVMGKFIPILFVGAGFGFNLLESQPLRQIVGVEANWGTRSLLMLCFVIAWVVITLYLWPWKTQVGARQQKEGPTTPRTVQ